MKTSVTFGALTAAIAVAVWVFLYFATSPPTAPAAAETAGIVAVSAVIAFVAARLTKRKREEEKQRD